MLFRNFIEERGKNSKEVVWVVAAVTWFLFYSYLGWQNCLIVLSWFWVEDCIWFAAPSSSQGDQSKLGGPEKLLSERSPGVGREERPPIAVVVHSPTGSAIYFFMLLNMNGCMYVISLFKLVSQSIIS